MRPFLRFLRANRSGLLWATSVLVIVGVWRLWAIENQPHHMVKVAWEIGSIAQGREGIVPNHDGTHAVYNQETEDGVGVYLYDVATGNNRLLLDQRESGYGTPENKCRMLDWSPDGSTVAYYVSMSYINDPPPQTIVLFNGGSGEKMAEIPASAYAYDSQFTWLTTNSFLYSTYQHRSWLIFSRNADRNWTESQVIKRFATGRLANLVVTSPHSIAWLQTNSIWTYDFTSGGLKKIWDTTNQLSRFAYDNDSGDYLFSCSDKSDLYIVRFRPPESWEKQGRILEVSRDPKRSRYADMAMLHGLYAFDLELDADSGPLPFTWDGMLVNHALCGGSLFLMGNRADSAPGIWQYDVASNKLHCLVSGLHDSLKYAQMIPFTNEVRTNSNGIELAYRLWAPAHVVPGKKYPVILGQVYGWTLDPQVAANEGCYFVAETMARWNDVRSWPKAVLALYGVVAQNQNIDTNRVYLIAYCAQAGYLEQVFDERPDICTGLILFHPATLPDLTATHVSKVLLIGGTDDKWSLAEKLKDYQNETVRSGVAVDLILQNGVAHINNSIATERGQAVALAQFLAKK